MCKDMCGMVHTKGTLLQQPVEDLRGVQEVQMPWVLA